MFVIIGIVVVLVAVFGGFLFAGGNLHVIWQPSELIIIGGAAIGSFIISSPLGVVKQTIGGVLGLIKPSHLSKDNCLDLLKLLFALLNLARREGLVSLEKHVENPSASDIFKQHPKALHLHDVVVFLSDTLKLLLSGGAEPHQLETLLDTDMHTQHNYEMLPANAVTKVADALPGLGIVAAVLGVVLTMGMITEPPEVLGHHIGAALVGTFLGVLACYGFVGPMATSMEHKVREHGALLTIVKAGLMAFAEGWPPIMAVEAARRATPTDVRPSYKELEEAVRNAK